MNPISNPIKEAQREEDEWVWNHGMGYDPPAELTIESHSLMPREMNWYNKLHEVIHLQSLLVFDVHSLPDQSDETETFEWLWLCLVLPRHDSSHWG